MHADRIGRQRHQSSYHQDRSDDGDLADKSVVRPADHPKHEAAADSEAEDQKDRRATEALGERGDSPRHAEPARKLPT